MDQVNKTPIPTPDTHKNNSATKVTLFTPCRRLGLKRKSAFTPEAASAETHTPNSKFINHKHSFETPKRVINFHESTAEESPTPKKANVEKEVVGELLKEDMGCAPPLKKNSLPTRRTPKFCVEIPSKEKILALQKTIEEKEERLAALNVELQEKNKDLDIELAERTEIWRKGCQRALQRLHEKTKSLGTEITMTEMITKLGIPYDVIQYDPDLEDFPE